MEDFGTIPFVYSVFQINTHFLFQFIVSPIGECKSLLLWGAVLIKPVQLAPKTVKNLVYFLYRNDTK